LENEYLLEFENGFSNALNTKIDVAFVLNEVGGGIQTTTPSLSIESNINNNYVFEKFVVGSFNKLAYNAAQSLFKGNY
jgi:chromosomal replication initiation ATPase DnaA